MDLFGDRKITPYDWFLIVLLGLSFIAVAYSSKSLGANPPFDSSDTPAVVFGFLFGLMSMIVGLLLYLSKNGEFPAELSVWGRYALALIICPVSFLLLYDSTNTLLDRSPPKLHHVHITNLWEEPFSDRSGTRYPRCYMTVESWRPDLPNIRLKIPAPIYYSLGVGQEVDLVSRSGFFNREYIVGNPKIIQHLNN